MTSTHQHHSSVPSRYSLPPPPPPSAQNDFRLPSLKDLNFQYRSPQGILAPPPTSAPENPPPQPEHSSATRHASNWARSNTIQASSAPSQPHPHQQHTPPLSAGAHEMSVSKVDYSSKQDNGGYVQPGLPLSAQVTPIPGSVNIVTSRGEEQSHSPNQPKRQRPSSATMSAARDVRASHPGYGQPQYGPYPPPSQAPTNSPYHQLPAGLPAPPNHPIHPAPTPPHDQIQHHAMPVSTHSNYPGYQYMPPRPPVMQSQTQHPAHPSQNSSNPYPSPGPPPTAPPPQGPWAQAHPAQHPPQQQQQQQHHHHHHPPSHPPSHHQLPPPTQQPHQHVQHIQPQATHQQPSVSMPSAPSHFVPQHPPQPPNPNPHPHYQASQQHPQQQQYQHHPQQSQQQPVQQQSHQQPNQPQHQQQQQPLPFARTTPIVPTNLDTRGPYADHESERAPSARADTMSEIAGHCNALYSFANRYAQTQSTTPHLQPTSAELEEMSHRAATVVRLLEELRRMNFPEAKNGRVASDAMQQSPEDSRPPKRPWEDISQEDGVPIPDPNPYSEYSSADAKTQSTAEQDMELIRTKRATSTAGANGSAGQPKSKYRKRSRATPPGKCHSCNIRETPEWRRGPDGARTLCNACGLHYAKLMRKRDKNNGEAPQIDLETLRASARAADLADKSGSRSSKQTLKSHQPEPASPMDTSKQQPLHHQNTFQVVTMMPPEQNVSMSSADTSRVPPPQQHQSMPPPTIPPPPWATSMSPTPRAYPTPDHIQHQSFMRSSQHSSAPSR